MVWNKHDTNHRHFGFTKNNTYPTIQKKVASYLQSLMLKNRHLQGVGILLSEWRKAAQRPCSPAQKSLVFKKPLEASPKTQKKKWILLITWTWDVWNPNMEDMEANTFCFCLTYHFQILNVLLVHFQWPKKDGKKWGFDDLSGLNGIEVAIGIVHLAARDGTGGLHPRQIASQQRSYAVLKWGRNLARSWIFYHPDCMNQVMWGYNSYCWRMAKNLDESTRRMQHAVCWYTQQDHK